MVSRPSRQTYEQFKKLRKDLIKYNNSEEPTSAVVLDQLPEELRNLSSYDKSEDKHRDLKNLVEVALCTLKPDAKSFNLYNMPAVTKSGLHETGFQTARKLRSIINNHLQSHVESATETESDGADESPGINPTVGKHDKKHRISSKEMKRRKSSKKNKLHKMIKFSEAAKETKENTESSDHQFNVPKAR